MYHYGIASHVPLEGSATYSEISKACGLNEIDLRRLLRHAMANHILQESDGEIIHTAASRVLVENAAVRDIVGIMCEEMFPGASRVGYPIFVLLCAGRAAYVFRRLMRSTSGMALTLQMNRSAYFLLYGPNTLWWVWHRTERSL